MKWLQTYKIHLLMVVFALSFFWSLVMWSNAEIENANLRIEKLKLEVAYQDLMNDYATMHNRVEIHIYKYGDKEIARDTIQPNKPKQKQYDKFKFAPYND